MNADGTSETVEEAVQRYTETVDGRIAQLTKQRDDLARCLRDVLKGFEDGVFVRNLENDGQRDWAVKLLPYMALLGRCNAAVLNVGVLQRIEAAAAERSKP